MTRGARESQFHDERQRKADAQLAENPPVIEWVTVPNSGGIRVARLVKEYEPKPGRRRKPECSCDIEETERRRPGDHHDDDCGRREPW